MPNFDRTGPNGWGKLGRGRGNCGDYFRNCEVGWRCGYFGRQSRWFEINDKNLILASKSVLEQQKIILEKNLEIVTNQLEGMNNKKE